MGKDKEKVYAYHGQYKILKSANDSTFEVIICGLAKKLTSFYIFVTY